MKATFSFVDQQCFDANPDTNFLVDVFPDQDPDWHRNVLSQQGNPWPSVADPDPGSGVFLTRGSRIRNRFFPDPGSRIQDPGSQTHIFASIVNIFGKKLQ